MTDEIKMCKYDICTNYYDMMPGWIPLDPQPSCETCRFISWDGPSAICTNPKMKWMHCEAMSLPYREFYCNCYDLRKVKE